MPVTITSHLSLAQTNAIQTLIPSSLSFPFEDAELFALYYTERTLLATAVFIREDEETFECCAYTAPTVRNQGIFSAMLDAALDVLPEDVSLVFYTNGTCSDTMAVLHALDAEWISDEHMMEYRLSSHSSRISACDSLLSASKTHNGSDSAPSDSMIPVCREQKNSDGSRLLHYESAYGTVYILTFSSYYYLYGFEIWEPYRNQGYGTAFLEHVLSDLASRNPLPVQLQVSGENHPAMALYKKTGFRITETLSCYLY